MSRMRRHDYLRRLPPECYRGRAFIHWSLTIEDRKTGWLTDELHLSFRELLTHSAARYELCCPIYCCMPDHIHMLWCGTACACDQRTALRFFRRHLNTLLRASQSQLQLQAYDHILREDELERSAFEEVAEYIARNPERKGLVSRDGFACYPFTGCVVPGYPDLRPFEDDYWDRFWRIYSRLVGRENPA